MTLEKEYLYTDFEIGAVYDIYGSIGGKGFCGRVSIRNHKAYGLAVGYEWESNAGRCKNDFRSMHKMKGASKT